MTECSNYNQQPGWIHEIRLGRMPGHTCGATRGCRIWPRCRDMHKVGSCPFPRGKNRKQLPRFPKWDCRRHVWMLGACRAAKGHGGGARWGHRAQRDTSVVPPPKRDLQRAVVSPWGGQLPVPFLTQKGTMDGTAAPQGHLCPVSSPRHLALTGINSTQLHRSGPFQGHDPITLVLPRALPEPAYRWMHGPQHHLCTRNLNQLPAAK